VVTPYRAIAGTMTVKVVTSIAARVRSCRATGAHLSIANSSGRMCDIKVPKVRIYWTLLLACGITFTVIGAMVLDAFLIHQLFRRVSHADGIRLSAIVIFVGALLTAYALADMALTYMMLRSSKG